MKTIPVGGSPVGIAVGEGAVWVVSRQTATVSRIDPATDAVTNTVPVGREPTAIAVGAGGVWVANSGDGTVARIDPVSRRVTVHVRSSPAALAVVDGSVWTAALPSPASHRGGTLRVESFAFSQLDPGLYEGLEWVGLAYDGLLAHRRAGGSTFGQLVGNLATDVPQPSPDGRTYVLRLRSGIRYSDGEPVRPEDFRAALEDLLRRHGKEIPPYFSRIRGAQECISSPKRCDLSRGIETDATARTITIRLTQRDPDLLYALAFPFAYLVPAEHPFDGKAIPPGTGPYRIAALDPRRGVRLVRNPRFHVWSQDARPDGFPDEIVGDLSQDGSDWDRRVRTVQRGNADVIEIVGEFGSPLSRDRIRAIQAQSAGQLSVDVAAELDYMFMDVTSPPFDDVRVRRAVNYATDRRRAAAVSRGADVAQPTCQLMPVSFQGYQPSCRYTRNPRPAMDRRGHGDGAASDR